MSELLGPGAIDLLAIAAATAAVAASSLRSKHLFPGRRWHGRMQSRLVNREFMGALASGLDLSSARKGSQGQSDNRSRIAMVASTSKAAKANGHGSAPRHPEHRPESSTPRALGGLGGSMGRDSGGSRPAQYGF